MLLTATDALVILEIPAISIGTDWHTFSRDFFTDVARTVPYDFSGLTLKSGIRHVESGREYPVTVTRTANRLAFSMLDTETSKLPPGTFDWDVLILENGFWDVLAVGRVTVERRATPNG
jgi:hypothetical protein